MKSNQPGYEAAGDILPCRFFKLSGADNKVVVCGAGERAVGVSIESIRTAPYPGTSETNAYTTGDPVGGYTIGDVCDVIAGGTLTAGNLVKSGAAGVGLVANTAGDIFNGICLQGASSGEKAKVYIIPGVVGPVTATVAQSQVLTLRSRCTASEINAGKTLLTAVAGLKYRVVDCKMVAYGGNAGGATTVDLLATQGASSVKLVAATVGVLTQSAVVRAGATNASVLADGASFVANDANTAVTVGKTGSSLTTATGVDVEVSYVVEAA